MLHSAPATARILSEARSYLVLLLIVFSGYSAAAEVCYYEPNLRWVRTVGYLGQVFESAIYRRVAIDPNTQLFAKSPGYLAMGGLTFRRGALRETIPGTGGLQLQIIFGSSVLIIRRRRLIVIRVLFLK